MFLLEGLYIPLVAVCLSIRLSVDPPYLSGAVDLRNPCTFLYIPLKGTVCLSVQSW